MKGDMKMPKGGPPMKMEAKMGAPCKTTEMPMMPKAKK